MVLSITERRFVDYFLGNQNGHLEYFEAHQLVQIEDSETDDIFNDLYHRSLKWTGNASARMQFAEFLQNQTSFVETMRDIRSKIGNGLDEVDFTPTEFRSAFVVENSTGNMVGYYTHDFETVERYLHPGIVMSALMMKQGLPETSWERIQLKPFPMPLEEADNFWAYHAASLWGQHVEVERAPDLEKPFVLFNILGSFTLFDIFVRDPNAYNFYNADFDNHRCAITRSPHACPSTPMSRQTLSRTIPPGHALVDYFAGRDLVYLPIPLGNNIVKAIYHPDHNLDYEIALELLEHLLMELEKLPHPPIVFTMTHGSMDGHVAVDRIANQLQKREDCYTFPNRARWQQENLDEAGYQEKDLCPITKSQIEAINRQIENYNAKLKILANRYPHLKLSKQAELYRQILTEGYYWDPRQERKVPFKREDLVGLDGVHWTPDYSLIMGNQATEDLNRIFNIHLPYFNPEQKPKAPTLLNNLTPFQKIFYRTIEENRRTYYKNQFEGRPTEPSPWGVGGSLEFVSYEGEWGLQAKLILSLFLPDFSFGIETGRVVTPIYFVPEVGFTQSLDSRDFALAGGVATHVGSPMLSIFVLPEYRHFLVTDQYDSMFTLGGGLETNLLWACSTELGGGSIVYQRDQFFTGSLYWLGGYCRF